MFSTKTFTILIFIPIQSRSLNSGYFPASTSSKLATPLTSIPLSLPLNTMDSCRPHSSSSFVPIHTPHKYQPPPSVTTPHNSLHTPHSTVQQEPMIVLRKQDLEKLFKEQIESVRICFKALYQNRSRCRVGYWNSTVSTRDSRLD